MLSSSQKYLEALRKGNYICFLQWPAFIAEHYRQEQNILGADQMMDFLVGEWIAHGIGNEDLEHLAILYAVYILEPSPLQWGEWAYLITTVFSALFVCMAYHAQPQRLGVKDIATLTEAIGQDAFNKCLADGRDDFLKQTQEVDKAIVSRVCKKISLMTEKIAVIDEYSQHLQEAFTRSNSDELLIPRLSMTSCLAFYLRDYTELTEQLRENIAKYTNKIRAMNPAEWETAHLQKIAPPTPANTAIGILAQYAYTFFKMVQRSNSSAEVSSSFTLTNSPLNRSG